MNAPEVMLGTAQFGMDYGLNNKSGKVLKKEIEEILHFCVQNDILSLDTAQAYGVSEKTLGEILAKDPLLSSKFKIYSKFSLSNSESFLDSLKKSLKTLNSSSLEGFSFHSFQDFKNFSADREIETAKEEGLLKNAGVSVYSEAEAMEALKTGFIDFIQMPFNLLDNLSKRKNVFELADEASKKIQVRSVFLQGLFFMSREELQVRRKNLLPLVPYIEEVQRIVMASGYSLHRVALSYFVHYSNSSAPILGVESLAQLSENVSILREGPVSKDVADQISSVFVECTELLYPYNW